ncbi:hypothetical protein DKX38_028963 [Salix brachista]|uniref:Uncharacterized protein n=1 Tax=Salix brachista TaxID=2182728 RepID=A0A5N5J2T0_9ROSI|nr:hypothetical protein DKX38_028963 [Salix brachista]
MGACATKPTVLKEGETPEPAMEEAVVTTGGDVQVEDKVVAVDEEEKKVVFEKDISDAGGDKVEETEIVDDNKRRSLSNLFKEAMPWLLKLAGWRVSLRNLGFKAKNLVESEKDTSAIVSRIKANNSDRKFYATQNEKGKEPTESDDAPAEQEKPETSESDKPTEPEVPKEEPSAVKEAPPAPAPPAAEAAEPKTSETLEEKKPVQTETKTTETAGEKKPEETR